jgi:hypothetical protein
VEIFETWDLCAIFFSTKLLELWFLVRLSPVIGTATAITKMAIPSIECPSYDYIDNLEDLELW